MKMRKCVDNHYTLEEKCFEGKTTVEVHPPKWSPEKEERLGKYRRAGESQHL